MREIRPSGSEGGVALTPPSLPLSPFSGAKSARLTFPRLRRRSPHDEFGRDGRAHLSGASCLAKLLRLGRCPSRAPVENQTGQVPAPLPRKLLCETRSRATEAVALPVLKSKAGSTAGSTPPRTI